MINNKKILVVMPAYNAEKTLKKTYEEIDKQFVDEILVVDDASKDNTVTLATNLGLTTIVHRRNLGYGGNQKTCYRYALKTEANIIVILHPDYQYTPKLIPALVCPIAYDVYDIMLGSRILRNSALKGGMPLYKYISNRILTSIQNILIGTKLSEFHTGYRAFSREVIENLPLEENSDDFIFDNQVILQAHFSGYRIGELSCPTLYFKEASSINLFRSIKYGLGCLLNSLLFIFAKFRIFKINIFNSSGRKLGENRFQK